LPLAQVVAHAVPVVEPQQTLLFGQSAASSHANGAPVVTQPGNEGKHPVGNGGNASGSAQHTFVRPLVMAQAAVPHEIDIGVATPAPLPPSLSSLASGDDPAAPSEVFPLAPVEPPVAFPLPPDEEPLAPAAPLPPFDAPELPVAPPLEDDPPDPLDEPPLAAASRPLLSLPPPKSELSLLPQPPR
jgi:hypothetical protein